jgi:copper chaperone
MTQDLIFSVPDMDCGACVRAITEAVHRLDATASVAADLASKLVRINGKGDFASAIEDAGFTANKTQ